MSYCNCKGVKKIFYHFWIILKFRFSRNYNRQIFIYESLQKPFGIVRQVNYDGTVVVEIL